MSPLRYETVTAMDAERETGLDLNPKWDERGLIQAVAVDAASGAVLMVAHMDAAALAATLATGEAHYWSRSRREVWHKGGTSGNVQRVRALHIDCDQDAVVLSVEAAGPACHTGAQTCFYRAIGTDGRLTWTDAPRTHS